MLWRYNKEAVALRIAFFTSARSGGEAHTVLVRDVPGLPYGTLAARIEDTVLRFLPRFIKRRIVVGALKDPCLLCRLNEGPCIQARSMFLVSCSLHLQCT